jgi:hypothetical protein
MIDEKESGLKVDFFCVFVTLLLVKKKFAH